MDVSNLTMFIKSLIVVLQNVEIFFLKNNLSSNFVALFRANLERTDIFIEIFRNSNFIKILVKIDE